MADPRRLAWRVLRTRGSASPTAEELLRRELAAVELGEADRRLAYELVLGTIRWRGLLDYNLDACTDRPLHSLQPELRELLRLGAYQLLRLDRVPDYAAVSTAVELARSEPSTRRAGGLVNAVLRRLLREAPAPPQPDSEPLRHLAVSQSHPRWLVERWSERFGLDETRRLAAFDNTPRPTFVFPAPGVDVDELRRRSGLEFTDEPGFPDCLRLVSSGDPASDPLFQQGLAYAADPATTLAAYLAVPDFGGSVLDACAAPGGKLAHLRRRGGSSARLTALELSVPRLSLLEENAERLKLDAALVHGDLLQPPFFGHRLDRVLVDAPCSNTGVLARRVEARWRLSAGDIERLSDLQVGLLRAAARMVKRGGLLIYSTCSLEPEENSGVVERFLKRRSDFILEPITAELLNELGLPAERLTLADGCAWSLPQHSGLDGAFAARLRALP
jgi:16S rRNA (cytosine967-C5)-methyltransferase